MLKDEYGKITREIIGCAMEVHKILGNIKFNLRNLINLNKITVQTYIANGHFGINMFLINKAKIFYMLFVFVNEFIFGSPLS